MNKNLEIVKEAADRDWTKAREAIAFSEDQERQMEAFRQAVRAEIRFMLMYERLI